MKLFGLVLLVILVQPFPPLGGQSIDKQSQKSAAHAKASGESQTSSNPLASTIVVSNCGHEYEHTDATQNDAAIERPESHKQPQAWSRSEILTGIYDALTGLLVFIALGTGIAIALQAKETARATQAIQAQVALQMETLRPRLTVGFEGSQFKPMTEGHAARMVAKVINTGGTPAYRVVAESWIEFLPMSLIQFTAAAEYWKGDSFPVYPTQPITYPVMRSSPLTDGEIKATFKGTHCLCLRLRLNYEDLGKPKFSDFVFGSAPNGVTTLKSDAD